jgi:predicted DNA-binding protein YlxM (UPF0122 family)
LIIVLRKGLSMEGIHENIAAGALKERNKYRERIDLLRSRIYLLAGEDRLLMTMYLENGNSFRQMARLAGVSESSIGRRVRKIAKRLTNGAYITCLRNRDKFTGGEMATARDYFLQGLSIRKIAEKRDLTFYRVQETLKKIKNLIEDSG